MSFIIDGANGHGWQVSSWVFHGASNPLLKALRERPETTPIADRIQEGLEMGIGYADISDLLGTPERNALWMHAIDETLSELRRQGNSDWKDPSRFSEFLSEIEKLKSIALVPQTA